MDSTSKRPETPASDVDHVNAELKKMSDSTISPVVESMKKLVAASVRSSSGRFWKPSTVAPSPEVGLACVKPTNCEEVCVLGTACQVRTRAAPRSETAAL